MSISVENNYLTTLFNAGNDAQSNLYTVAITGGGLDDLTTALMIRADGFTEPTIEQQSYDTRFIIAKVSRPRAKINVTKSFNITFRVDANYQVYQSLQNKMNQMVNANSTNHKANISVEYIKENGFNVQVNALISNNVTLTLGKYKYCWISSIDPVSFKQGTSDPLSVRATIFYLEHEDIQSDSTDKTLAEIAETARQDEEEAQETASNDTVVTQKATKDIKAARMS